MEKYLVYLPFVPPVLTALWLLICLRFYTLISKENPGQRRLIAVGGAIGAALIYILASNMILILKPEEKRIKVQMKQE